MQKMRDLFYTSETNSIIEAAKADKKIRYAQTEGIYPEQKKAARVYVDMPPGPYAISLGGIHPTRIPHLLPSLTTVALNTGKIVKIEMIEPAQLYGKSRQVVDGARQLKQFLQETSKGNTQHVASLIIQAEQYPYMYGRLMSGSLEKLPAAFNLIKAGQLHLRHLEFTVLPHSANVLHGLAFLISQGHLHSLESLRIKFSEKLFAVTTCPGSYPQEDVNLATLYKTMTRESLPQLRSLEVTMWCQAPTITCRQMLERIYPQLHTLIIHRAELNKSLVIERSLIMAVFPLLLLISAIDDNLKNFQGRAKTLREIVKLHSEEQHLERFEVYNHFQWLDTTVVRQKNLNKYHQEGWLPHLSTLFPLEDNVTIAETAIVQCLYLTSPEGDGFQNWLEAIKEGSFPNLSYLYYQFPPRQESPYAYQQRMEALLDLISTAITKNRLPKFEAFIIEGPIPESCVDAVKSLEVRLLKTQFMKKLSKFELVGTEEYRL